MTRRDSNIAAALSLFLTISVGVNIGLFQQKSTSGIETASVGARTQWLDAPVAAQQSPAPAAAELAPSQAVPMPIADTTEINTAEITRGLQRELNSRNYEAGPPDGIAGSVTRAAIFAFEYDNGLMLSARPTADLLSRIVLGSSSIAPTPALAGRKMTRDGETFVRGVRQQLVALGYDVGTGEGLTPDFSRAVRKFEGDQKLSESGRISAPMMSRLIRLQSATKAKRDLGSKTALR